MLPEPWRNRGKEGYLKLLDQGVKWAEEAGLYVIINWHCMGNLPAGKFFPMTDFWATGSTDPHTGFYTTKQETFESYRDAITSYRAKQGISYTVWSFDPHWAPCLIKDWNFTPTRAGRYFKKVLQSPQP